MIWGIDVSSWQSQGSMQGNAKWALSDLVRFPLEEMRANGCRFAIAKASMQLSIDQTAEDHVRVCRDAGMEIGLYHWCDPIGNYATQKNLFLDQLVNCDPVIEAFDVEQYWASWSEYHQRNVKTFLSEDKIVDNFLYLYSQLQGVLNKPIIYTANWFTSRYCPTRSADLNVCDLWAANYTMARQYVLNQFGTYKLTSWGQFHELLNHIHNNWETFYDGSTATRTLIPKKFTKKELKVIQIDSLTRLPGCPYNIDLNLFNGTEAEFEQWLGLVPDPEPDPEPSDLEERVAGLEGEVYDITRQLAAVVDYLRNIP